MTGRVQVVGTLAANTLATTSQIVVPAGGVKAGNRLIARFVWNGSAVGLTCADSRGNTYAVDVAFVATASVAILSALVSTALQPGDTITVTHASANARLLQVEEWQGLLTPAADQSAAQWPELPDTAPTSGLTPVTSQANELLIGVIGVPAADGSDETFTPGAGWNPAAELELSVGGQRFALYSLSRRVSATGAYEANGTLSVDRHWAAAIVTYRGSPMADPIAALSFCGIGLENTAGTPVKSQVELEMISESLQGTGEPIRRRSINRKRSAKGAVLGGYSAEGDINVEVTPDKITKLIYAVLTTLNTTGAADPFTHVFKTGNTLKPLTAQILKDDTYFVFPGLFVQRLVFRSVIDAILEATFTLAGKAKEALYDAEQSDVGIAASALDPFVFQQASVTLHGTPNTDTNNWEIAIDSGLIRNKGLGAGRAPNRAHPGDSVVTGSFDMVFDTIEAHRRWMGAASSAYPVAVGDSLQTFAAQLKYTQSANRELVIDLPKCYYTASEPPVSGREGLIIQRCQFATLYDSVEQTDVKLTLKNAEPNATVIALGTDIV